jgi:predicted outer membrane repeat protein
MNLNDSGAGSLRQAILDTPAGGTVDFQPDLTGTIALSTGELAITHALTIAGPGADAITVSGSHASRLFNIASASTVAISGLSIADGQASQGGGISVDGTLNISNCVISDNASSGNGGSIFIGTMGALRIDNSTVSDNTAANSGGGIFTTTGSLSISDSTLSGNHASNGSGGAVNTSSSHATFDGLTFQDNGCTSGDGGGGAINAEDMLSITDCSFLNNTSDSTPGGIARGGAVWGRTMTISGSTFSGNTAGNTASGSTGLGGAIHADNTSTIVNTTIVGNTVNGHTDLSGGGGVGIGFSTMTIRSCTITGNTDNSGVGGGGILNQHGFTLTLRNTIVAGNTAATADNGPDIRGSVATTGSVNNLIGIATGTYSGPGNGVQGNQVGSASAPIDPLLDTLQDNGGPTKTMALLAGSPALNAGDPNERGVADQRGVVRAGGVNIGAYQASADHLVFQQQPADTPAGETMASVIIQVVDKFGNVVAGDSTHTITVSIGTNPGGGTLSGTLTLTVTNGVATFSDLSIDLPGTGYTLHATIGGGSLPAIDSDPFNIT